MNLNYIGKPTRESFTKKQLANFPIVLFLCTVLGQSYFSMIHILNFLPMRWKHEAKNMGGDTVL